MITDLGPALDQEVNINQILAIEKESADVILVYDFIYNQDINIMFVVYEVESNPLAFMELIHFQEKYDILGALTNEDVTASIMMRG